MSGARALVGRPAHAVAAAVRQGAVRAADVVAAYLEETERLEPALRAFLRLDREGALARAEELDRRLQAGEDPGPLCGVPVAVKDNICTRGLETTAGSRILAGFVPPYDATVVERLRAAGAVIVGKTNLDEFAMGSSTENSAFGPTRNPWDPERVPGGSSGGSAAAVAAGEVPLALGSDTGGSVRQPAALCGVVGLKPTYGRVSRYGLIAFASSLDQIGPFGLDARDAALALQVLAGHDPRDATSAPVPVPDYLGSLTGDVRGLRVGLAREFLGEGVEPGVERAVREALAALRDLGAEVQEVSLPHAPYSVPTYYLVATAEASSNLARYDGVRYGLRAPADGVVAMFERSRGEGFGPEVKRRIMLGTYALSAGYYEAYYLRALKARRRIKEDFDRAFARVDVVVAPTSPTVAFRLGERTEDPLTMYLSDVCTIAANLAGLPALSIPCGFAGGLPVGLQLIGRPFEEALLLRAADAYQRVTDHHLRRPPLAQAAAAGDRPGGAAAGAGGGRP